MVIYPWFIEFDHETYGHIADKQWLVDVYMGFLPNILGNIIIHSGNPINQLVWRDDGGFWTLLRWGNLRKYGNTWCNWRFLDGKDRNIWRLSMGKDRKKSVTGVFVNAKTVTKSFHMGKSDAIRLVFGWWISTFWCEPSIAAPLATMGDIHEACRDLNQTEWLWANSYTVIPTKI